MFFKDELSHCMKINFVYAHFGHFKTQALTCKETFPLKLPSWAEMCRRNINK